MLLKYQDFRENLQTALSAIPHNANYIWLKVILRAVLQNKDRDRRFQAILPLKGKILNVEKARKNKIIENDEIRSMVTAIGAGLGDSEEFDEAKIRYGKIILMCDADVDGSHIRTLLLTFFFRHMREVIDTGKLLHSTASAFIKLKKGKQKDMLMMKMKEKRF